MIKNNISTLLRAVERGQDMNLAVTKISVGLGCVSISLIDPPQTVTVSKACDRKIKDSLITDGGKREKMTMLLIITIVVLITALKKKDKVEKTSVEEVTEDITTKEEERTAAEILMGYVYKRFDEFIKAIYKENLLRWETSADLSRGLKRASIPVKVYFTNGTFEMIRIFTDLETTIQDEVDGYKADTRLVLKQLITAPAKKTPAPKAEETPTPQPKKKPGPKKNKGENPAKTWWEKNKDKVLKMEKIILTEDILPSDIKEEVAKIMLNSQLFDNVLCDDEGVFATLSA